MSELMRHLQVRKKAALPLSHFLRDNYGRQHTYLRMSVTERCNLRCTYCMPEEGVPLTPSERLLTSGEIVRLAKLFVGEGVNKIRLTGGEPTVRRDIVDIVNELGKLRPLGLKEICMTSNGIATSRMLKPLVEAGLTHLNLSLDTLDKFKYELITRRRGLDKVLRTIDLALDLGIQPLKINCVVINKLNDGEIIDFVELTRDKNVEVRFIEYMPFDGNRWEQNKLVSSKDILATISETYGDLVRLNLGPNETARSWQVPGHVGRIGIISSMTDQFCGSCNRLRITADGNLKVCLLGSSEVNLRDQMREGAPDEQLLKIVGRAVGNKKKQHAGMDILKDQKNRPMILVGG